MSGIRNFIFVGKLKLSYDCFVNNIYFMCPDLTFTA